MVNSFSITVQATSAAKASDSLALIKHDVAEVLERELTSTVAGIIARVLKCDPALVESITLTFNMKQ